jgi:uncharacterized lipoprotein
MPRVMLSAFIFFLAACATQVPPTELAPEPERIARAPFDSIWTRVIAVFADARIPIQTIEKASGLIVSRPFTLPDSLEREWINCGTLSTTNEDAITWMQKNNNTLDAAIDFNVFVRPLGDSTAVRVNAGVTATAMAPAGRVPFKCVSTGVFERQLLQRLSGT